MSKKKLKPKLGFLIPRLGIVDRGAEICIYELSKRLCRDFQITVWIRKSGRISKMISDLQNLGVTIRTVSCISEDHWIARSSYTIKFLRLLLEKFHLAPVEMEMLAFGLKCLPELLKADSDILFPANGVWGAIICRFIRKLKGTPFIYASFGGIEPLIAKQKPDLYVAINPSIERWLKNHFPDLALTFIPTGVDLKKFSPRGKRAQIELSRPVFMTVSALIPTKHVDLTIAAVGRLKQGSLLIIGDGPQKPMLLQQAQKDLGSGRFHFQSVKYEELDQYYRSADVFTHAAPWEVGWSMVHLEALATNLPVIANNEENLQVLLKDAGITCEVTNIDEYARALNRALRMKVNTSRQKAVEKFSWEHIAKQYKKYFYDLL